MTWFSEEELGTRQTESAGDDRPTVPIRSPARSTAFYLETISAGISETLLATTERGERDSGARGSDRSMGQAQSARIKVE